MIELSDKIIIYNIEIIISASMIALILDPVKAIISKLKQKQQNPNSKIKELEEKIETGEFKFFKKLDSYKPEIFIERSNQ
jgi:hypothetical protein